MSGHHHDGRAREGDAFGASRVAGAEPVPVGARGRASPLVVEFVGLPGAGKTTIAHQVIDELTARGYRCFGHSTLSSPEGREKRSGGVSSKLSTLGRLVSSCLAHRRIAADALDYTVRVNPLGILGLQRLLKFLIRLDFVRELMEGDYDVLVLDQGPIQNLWSIATTGRAPASSDQLARVLRDVLDEVRPHVVLVDVEPDLAFERVAVRSTMRSRFDRMPPSEAEALLARHGALFGRLVELAEGFAATGFLRVDGRHAVEKSASLIVPFIERARQNHGA